MQARHVRLSDRRSDLPVRRKEGIHAVEGPLALRSAHQSVGGGGDARRLPASLSAGAQHQLLERECLLWMCVCVCPRVCTLSLSVISVVVATRSVAAVEAQCTGSSVSGEAVRLLLPLCSSIFPEAAAAAAATFPSQSLLCRAISQVHVACALFIARTPSNSLPFFHPITAAFAEGVDERAIASVCEHLSFLASSSSSLSPSAPSPASLSLSLFSFLTVERKLKCKRETHASRREMEEGESE